jgi:glyoxylase-like metal-dependent hydrolase (beta-lactamase superfamily II)
MEHELVDLQQCGDDSSVAAFILETEDGPALFDCGPVSTLPALRDGLATAGLEVGDLRHLLLSHIHLDHAGAAGALVLENPALLVHVSPIGAPHLVDPSRLESSARRIYGDEFDRLWGSLTPVPEANIRLATELVAGLECFRTPGHASHHVSYLHEDGTLYAGDAAGVRIPPDDFVFAPSAPPEIDVPLWEETIDELERRDARRIAIIHFGVYDDVGDHLGRLRQAMLRWSGWVGDGVDEETFVTRAQEEVRASGSSVERYERAATFAHSYSGLERYWRKRRELEEAG